jgi:hypothetical protein
VDVELADFRALIQRLTKDIPSEFQGGVVDIAVSSKTVPHPLRADVYTLGECIPLEWSGSGADLQSRVVLYHGSFQALARLGEFDWRVEAWDTLTHELRHHLEWQADVASLEAYDWAAEQNFARHEGAAFDPVFYRNGEAVGPGVWKVDDDVFIEEMRGAGTLQDIGGKWAAVTWHGAAYRVRVPAAERRAWVFLTLQGLDEPPPGDVVLVISGRSSMVDLFRDAPKTASSEAAVERWPV